MEEEGVLQPAAVPIIPMLPDGVLADVLRHLPPRGLAVSRCVCKAWRDAVDGRRLLRADVLPQSVRGIILAYQDLDDPAFLSRPTTAGADDIDIFAGARPCPSSYVFPLDHCNGLVLFEDQCGLVVSNPATKQWTHLPPPPPRFQACQFERLVFDPIDSLHYEVVLVPRSLSAAELDTQLQEWPPSTWVLCVFSSLTGKWEERSFAREGELLGTSSVNEGIPWDAYGAYCRGALYVPCYTRTPFVLRISLSNHKYRGIQVPTEIVLKGCDYVLGRSENMVCLASIQAGYILRIWILDESCGLEQWVLKHHIELESTLSCVSTNDQRFQEPWIFQVFNQCEWFVEGMFQLVNRNDNIIRLKELKYQWDSDNDNFLDLECEVDYRFKGYISWLGFHPFKPIIFLSINQEQAVAFHLNTSKVQILGNTRPEYYDYDDDDDDDPPEPEIEASFLYTPCFMADFP